MTKARKIKPECPRTEVTVHKDGNVTAVCIRADSTVALPVNRIGETWTIEGTEGAWTVHYVARVQTSGTVRLG